MDTYKAQRLYDKDIYTWPAFEEMHYICIFYIFILAKKRDKVFSIIQSFLCVQHAVTFLVFSIYRIEASYTSLREPLILTVSIHDSSLLCNVICAEQNYVFKF
jgi:hypothetical protein